MIGQTVGSYRVTARLGAGGMGEVYRATDTRLGREVALKFSTEQFSERFEREARAVAALNHPNICTLYDLAENYLVMELVEGVTLAERIVEGPIPLEKRSRLSRQTRSAIAGRRWYLLFVNAGTLFAVRFDADQLEVQGTPLPVIEGIGGGGGVATGPAQVDASLSGTLVYRTASGRGQFVGLLWIDEAGKATALPLKEGPYLSPRVSPEGDRVALTIASETNQNVGVYDIKRQTLPPLTFNGVAFQFPVWTPDGRYIVFSGGTVTGGMFWTRADGASQPQRLTQSKFGQFP